MFASTDNIEVQFKELYFQHFSLSARTAYYILKNQDAAEDIAQEVFVKLWNKRNDLDAIQNLKGYIAQLSRNAALDHLKQNKVYEEVFELEEKIPDETKEDRSSEIRKALESAVGQLSPQCRLIFSMSRFEGLSNDEIADFLDISKRTVETQISLALKRFRTDLRQSFIDLLLLFTFFQFF